MTIGTLTMNTEPHQKCSSRMPPVIGPRPIAERRHAGPDADGLAPLARVGEDVRDDREGRRHDERAADAHERAGDDQRRRPNGASAESSEPDAEQRQADGEEPVATEAVAEASGGEQQAREHERVGVDDPLQLARAWRRGRPR